MKKSQKNKYFNISPQKEVDDMLRLCTLIEEEKWVDNSTTIINCNPDYSSIAVQYINHTLSKLNKNELFPVINLEMPTPNMSQVWVAYEDNYELYDTYIDKWIKKYLFASHKVLFVQSSVVRGRNFNKLKLCFKDIIGRENYRLASLYVDSSSLVIPDYYVQKFDKEKDGGLLFWWENPNNPNWNY